jgi:peptide/nickel transport system substrate-binding protein
MIQSEYRSSLLRVFWFAFGCTLLVLVMTACTATQPIAARDVPADATTMMVATTPETTPSPTVTNTPTPVPVTPTATPVPPTPTPEIPQGGILTIRLSGNVSDLKPWDLRSRDEEIITDLLYNGLVRLDEERRPQPDLAQNWEVSPDGGLITFTLRSNATWHDGQPITADDVIWTLEMLRTIPPINALLFELQSMIREVRAPSPNTAVVSLTEAYAPILALLTVPILPQHQFHHLTSEQIAALNFWEMPVGSGPFMFAQWQENQMIVFSRNDAFFRGAPNLEQVALLNVQDPQIAAGMLQTEELLLSEFAASTQPFSDTPPAPVDLGAYPENGWYGIVFNMRPDRLFADRRLRQALARVVDVPELVQTLTGGAGEPIATTILSDTWAYPNELEQIQPNLDEARRLLDEAGWTVGEEGVRQKDGQPLAARLWVRGDDPRRVAAAEFIAGAAQEIGMQLEVMPSDFDTVIVTKLAPPYEFDLLLGSWVNAPNTASFPTNRFYDPDDYALFHSSRLWRGQGDARTGLRNISGFTNPEYDQAAGQARRTYDPRARTEAIAEAQKVLQREYPYLFLWSDRISVALNQRVGSEDGPINLNSPRYLWNIERWYIEP